MFGLAASARSVNPRTQGSRRWGLLLAAGLVTGAAFSGPVGPVGLASSDRSAATVRLAPVSSQQKGGSTKFIVASFNVLGWTHTVGSKHYEGGVKRMERTVHMLRHRNVGVVGFQELQPQQYEKFKDMTGKRWGLYPGARLERIEMHNSLAWRKRIWEMVDRTVLKIPYFFGDLVRMPVVKLRHKETGRAVYFANFHNPADSYGNAQKWRNQAMRKQIRLAKRKFDEGVPLVITGDMNEREQYFCAMVGRAPMRAAQGGSNAGGDCNVPSPIGIDWIFGSKSIQFTGYQKLETERVHKISDHPFLVTEATIPAK